MVWQRRERGGTFGNYDQGWGYNPGGFGFLGNFDPGMASGPLFMHAPQAPMTPPTPQVPQFQWNRGRQLYGSPGYGGTQQYGLGVIPGGQSSLQSLRQEPSAASTVAAASAEGERISGGNQGGYSWANNSLPWWELGMMGVIGAGQLGLGFSGLNEARIQGRASRRMASQNYQASVKAYNNALRDRIEGRGGLTREAIEREYQQKRQK